METLKITDMGHVLNKIDAVVFENKKRFIELSENWTIVMTKKTSEIIEVFVLFDDKFFEFKNIPVCFTINIINFKMAIVKAIALGRWAEQLVAVLAEIDIYKDFRRFNDEEFKTLVMRKGDTL